MTVVEMTPARDLQFYEAIVGEGLRKFAETGRALAHIRDEKLYSSSHETFEAYCVARWSLGRRRAYQLIEAARIVDNVQSIAQEIGVAPTNDLQARALGRLPAAEQPKAWARAVATAPEGRVTAKHVAAVVAEQAEPAMEESGDLAPKLHLVKKPAKPSRRTAERIETDEKIRELSERGLIANEIAAELGIKPGRVYDGKTRLGIVKHRGPIEGLISAALEGFDTWEFARLETGTQWAAASRAEVEELVSRLDALVGSIHKMRRSLNRELDRRPPP